MKRLRVGLVHQGNSYQAGQLVENSSELDAMGYTEDVPKSEEAKYAGLTASSISFAVPQNKKQVVSHGKAVVKNVSEDKKQTNEQTVEIPKESTRAKPSEPR
ncbi:hypothetical protein LCGC14_0452490 [marine sediment metagenome]|uniref:Uncharacterized protein n=1 Tax=marine sediment metagenome TaxID=412755 RepID=A0A0F9VRJ8_9ZZZZ